jgi:hypothetical protein
LADVRHLQLNDAESVEPRFGLVPTPLIAPDPNLLEYLRKHQNSVVPDRRVFFDAPNHGFASNHGRLLCEAGESPISRIARTVKFMMEGAAVNHRKDGLYLNVIDERERNLGHWMNRQKFDGRPSPLKQNATHATLDHAPLPRRLYAVKWLHWSEPELDIARSWTVT